MADTRFGGSINLDVRDSVPDWDAFTAELTALWLTEAQANNVLPLNDYAGFRQGSRSDAQTALQDPVPESGQYTYYPGASLIPEASAANTHAVSVKILAQLTTEPHTQGVIFAQGSRFGGHALCVKDGRIYYVYKFLGVPPLQVLEADLPAAGRFD
jgi:arylsulfatase